MENIQECRVHSRVQGAFKGAGCIQGCRVHSRVQGAFKGAGCIQGCRVHLRVQGAFKGAECIQDWLTYHCPQVKSDPVSCGGL